MSWTASTSAHRMFGRFNAEVRRLAGCYATDRSLRLALGAVFGCFLFLILLHTLHYFAPKLGLETSHPAAERMSLNQDHGYGEIFAYLLCALFVVSMRRAYARTHQRIYIVFALVFSLILLDDALQLHERIGEFLTTAIGLPSLPYVSDAEIGQLAGFICLGVPILGAIYYGFRHSTGSHVETGAILSVILCGLGFFAVVADHMHGALEHKFRGAHLVFTIVEDGGEILMIILAWTVGLAISRRRAEMPAAGRVRGMRPRVQ